MAHNGRREVVALGLAAGRTVRDAAREAGCGERSVHRWLGDPAFRGRVAALRTELFGLAAGRLSELACRAAETLGALLEAKNESVRLQAAKAVLECGTRLHESLDIARRLEDLEGRLAEPLPQDEVPA
jgi:hypothetical protein